MGAEFETAAMRARASIRARFEVYDAVLHGTAGFIAVEKDVNRERFRKYVEHLNIEENYPGVQATVLRRVCPAPEKDSVVAAMRQQGEEHFHIWPTTTRADFFPDHGH